MPIRATVSLVATAVGVVLLFSFRTPPSTAPITAVTVPTPTASASPTATATPSGAPPSGSGSPAPSATPAATPTPVASGLRSGTFTGQAYNDAYGNIQVAVVISGGKITDVKVLQYPQNEPQSSFISSQALPLLREEVLRAQSARIDAVSGATFTSENYAASVQSALDAARA
jgi:uncharacterized protein with FMN-binding domain